MASQDDEECARGPDTGRLNVTLKYPVSEGTSHLPNEECARGPDTGSAGYIHACDVAHVDGHVVCPTLYLPTCMYVCM